MEIDNRLFRTGSRHSLRQLDEVTADTGSTALNYNSNLHNLNLVFLCKQRKLEGLFWALNIYILAGIYALNKEGILEGKVKEVLTIIRGTYCPRCFQWYCMR